MKKKGQSTRLAKKSPKRGAKTVAFKKAPAPTVHRLMSVMEIVDMHPAAADVLGAYGLHCVGCAFSQSDTLEDGAILHNLSEDDVENMILDLNEALKKEYKPKKMTVTEAGALALKDVAAGEGKTDSLLRVMTDEAGGFCMEFTEVSEPDDVKFGHKNVKGLTLIASPGTLMRIGGATIDFRDGRFKLDLPKKDSACACGKEVCDCSGNCCRK